MMEVMGSESGKLWGEVMKLWGQSQVPESADKAYTDKTWKPDDLVLLN